MKALSGLWLGIMDRESIYDALFSYCTPATIHRTSRTCKASRLAVSDYNTRAYDINTSLRRFFSDPASFRRLQLHTGCVISGSFALQFMDRTVYPESDLDVYVRAKQLGTVLKWLGQEDMGYSLARAYVRESPLDECALSDYDAAGVPNEDMSTVDTDGAKCTDQLDLSRTEGLPMYGVYTFLSTGGERKIQVISLHHSPIQTILSFHSTVVMNVITYSAAISFFPWATFENHMCVICTPCPDASRTRQALEKYAERGWRVEPYIKQRNDGVCSGLQPGQHWVGDRRMWTMTLPTGFNQPLLDEIAKCDPDPLFTNGFTLTYEATGHGRAVARRTKFFVRLKHKMISNGNDHSLGCYVIPRNCYDTVHTVRVAFLLPFFTASYLRASLSRVRQICIEECTCEEENGSILTGICPAYTKIADEVYPELCGYTYV